MNTRILLVLLLVSTGCTPLASRTGAIQSVLQQRATAKGTGEEIGPLNARLVSSLKHIEVRKCPEDFRSAWIDYVVELEDLNTRLTRLSILVSEGKVTSPNLPLVLGAIEKNPVLGQYLLTSLDRVDETWKKLERAVMKYGIVPERDASQGPHGPIPQSN